MKTGMVILSSLLIVSFACFSSTVDAHPTVSAPAERQLSALGGDSAELQDDKTEELPQGAVGSSHDTYRTSLSGFWTNSYTFFTKFSNYVSAYTANTIYKWMTYSWSNPSTGIGLSIAFFSVIYGWILVSGWTVNGRRMMDSLANVDESKLEALADKVNKAVAMLDQKFGHRTAKLLDSEADELQPEKAFANFAVSAGSPTWSTSVTQASSWSGYISTVTYNVLKWLAQPYGAYITSLAGLALYMIAFTIIIMTGGVFPSVTVSGRRGSNGRNPKMEAANGDDDFLGRTTESILRGIDMWTKENLRSDENRRANE